MAEIVTKTCSFCGSDLNGQKRVKNAAGEYFCPPCWDSHRAIFGDDAADVKQAVSAPVLTAAPPPPRTKAAAPVVKVVHSELQPTIAQAMVQGAKQGAVSGLFRGFRKALLLFQVIAVLGVTKKLFPETNNGMMIVLTLVSAIAAMLEADAIARATKLDSPCIDKETLKSTAGIMIVIGFALAFALAIFLAVTGK